MSKMHSITSKGITERYSEAVEKLQRPGDYVIVTRGLPRSIVMVCPDGCGENITINLDRRTGKAWRKYEAGEKLTIYPSVWRDTGCRAHFIIWKNHIIWCGAGEHSKITLDETTISKVLNKLSPNSYMYFESIADQLQESPWDALWSCKELVHRGRALEGDNKDYRRIESINIQPINSGRIDFLA
jgi:hypothetical protein